MLKGTIDTRTPTFSEFTDDNAVFFDTINRQWIEEMFMLEPIDERVLTRPRDEIINKGGRIFFVSTQEYGVVGTCALMKMGPSRYELTKMGVLGSARGLKIGEQLLRHVLHEATTMQIEELFLLTNAKCEAAIHLYEKLGFEHSDEILQKYGREYARCNVAMLYNPCR